VSQGSGFFTLGGASRGKLLLAGASVVAAIVVLVTQLSSIGGDGGDALAPLRTSAMPAGRRTLDGGPELALARERHEDDADLATAAASVISSATPTPPASAASATSPSVGEIDVWRSLFDRVMERQGRTADPAAAPPAAAAKLRAPPPALDGHQLTGIVRNDGRSRALLDGRLFRVGDRLPDSPLTVAGIDRDRVRLSSPEHPDGLFVLLEPLRSRAADGPEAEPEP